MNDVQSSTRLQLEGSSGLMERTEGFWIGRLSACIGENAKRASDKPVRRTRRSS